MGLSQCIITGSGLPSLLESLGDMHYTDASSGRTDGNFRDSNYMWAALRRISHITTSIIWQDRLAVGHLEASALSSLVKSLHLFSSIASCCIGIPGVTYVLSFLKIDPLCKRCGQLDYYALHDKDLVSRRPLSFLSTRTWISQISMAPPPVVLFKLRKCLYLSDRISLFLLLFFSHCLSALLFAIVPADDLFSFVYLAVFFWSFTSLSSVDFLKECNHLLYSYLKQ